MNGTVGAVHSRTAFIMQPTGGIATAQLLVSHDASSPGSSPRVEYVVHPSAPTYRSSGSGYSGNSGGGWSGRSNAPASISTGWHESAPHTSVSAPSATNSSAPGGHH